MQQQIQECVVKTQDELAVTNEEIKTLKPQLQLDTLQERSKLNNFLLMKPNIDTHMLHASEYVYPLVSVVF